MAKETNNKYEVMAESSVNVQTDAVYQADAERVAGVITGVARSILYNTAARQNSKIAVAIANFMARKNPLTDIDTVLTTEEIDALLEDSIKDAAASGPGSQVITVTYVSLGRYVANITPYVFNDQNKLTLKFVGTVPSADLELPAKVSVDNGVIDYPVKLKDTLNVINVGAVKDQIADIFRNSADVIINRTFPVSKLLTFDSIMNSTYGLGKPIKGISELVEARGLFLNQMFPNGDFADTSEWTIGSRWSIAGGVATFDDTGTGYMQQSVNFIDNNTYFLRFEIKNINTSATIYINGDSGLLFDELSYPSYTANGIYYYVLTANQNATVLKFYGDATSVGTWDLDNFMCIDITNTPLYNHTAPQINNIVQEYIEGPTYITDFELSTRGVNLFDKSQYTAVDYAYKIRIKPSQDYKWAESIAYKLYDIGENELSSGTSTTVTTTSSTYYIAFANTIADTDAFILNEGTVLKTWAEFNSPETNFKLIDFNGKSVGTDVYDKAYYLNGKWWKDEEVGTALAVAIGDVIDTTAIPTIKPTTGKFYAVDTVNNESQYGTYGDTLTLTGTATVYFELATVVTTELEKDGSLIQESNTTIIQHGIFATNYTMKFALNKDSSLLMVIDKTISLQQEVDKLQEHISILYDQDYTVSIVPAPDDNNVIILNDNPNDYDKILALWWVSPNAIWVQIPQNPSDGSIPTGTPCEPRVIGFDAPMPYGQFKARESTPENSIELYNSVTFNTNSTSGGTTLPGTVVKKIIGIKYL